MEYVLQAQNRDWYSFLNRCLDCGRCYPTF
ncbi:hypothetical protein [Enterococcus faecium]